MWICVEKFRCYFFVKYPYCFYLGIRYQNVINRNDYGISSHAPKFAVSESGLFSVGSLLSVFSVSKNCQAGQLATGKPEDFPACFVSTDGWIG